MPWNFSLDDLEAVPRPVVALARDYPGGHRIAPHRHARAQLVYAASGVMTVTTDGGAWVVPPERAVWMPAGVTHAIDCAGSLAMRTLYVRSDAAPDPPGGCRVVNVSPLLRELILHAVAMPALYDEAGPDGRVAAVILDQLRALPAAPLHLAMPSDRRLRRVAEALLADPADGRSLDQWAALAGISARSLARHFLQETGQSFGAWRQQARLLTALAWLAEGRSVTATALDLGYESPSAFIAMFRRAFGTTPGRYFGGEAGGPPH